MAKSGTFSATTARAISLLALASAIAVPSAAQEAAAEDEGNEDIVVTAQKREQQLLDVPLAIQAISGEDLEASGARELNDLIESIPGASSVSRTAPGFETIQIRGISSGTTGDATVGYYVDDVPFSVPNLQLAPPSRLFDLQRVEVLRGPQGTLYGQGAMGGTIRMVTASPDLDEIIGRFQGEISSTAGGEAGAAVDGVFNLPLARDVAAVRISGGYEKVGGFADSTTLGREDINDSVSWNLRAKLRINPSENVNVELGAWRVENALDFRNTMDSADPPVINTVAAGSADYIDSSLTLLSAVVNADLGGAQLTSSTAYIDHELDFNAAFLAGAILRNDSVFATTSFTQELRLASTGDGPFNWLVGGYYSDGKIDSDICLSLFVPCTTTFSININSAGRINTQAWAVFGELSYAMLDDRLIATVGGRYFEDDRNTRGTNRNTNVTTGAGDTFTTFNPRFNLSFKASDDLLFYGNIAKGFRSGAFQSQAQADAASTALGIPVGVAIEPDTVWSYEAGVKGRLADGLLTIDSAVYSIDWSNIQLQSTINGVATLSNGGNARSRGIDIGVGLRPMDGLQFMLVANFNDTEFTSVLPAIVALNPLAAPGTRIPGVPKNSYMVSASYGWSLWGLDASLNASYNHRASQLDSSGVSSDDLDELNLRASIASDTMRFTLFADNVTNERRALTRGSLGVQPNFPRRFGARFSVDF
jgi:iron complex outermembrane receptor protein